MIPSSFDYAAPRTLAEAIHLLQDGGDEAKLLAGGHSLIPLMKLRLAAPALLVDLGRIDDLRYIRDAGDHVAIGSMTTYHALETSDLLRERVPMVPEAAATVGDMQVRNRGTLGGTLAHADPASDLPSVVLALRAALVAMGPAGERVIPADTFFEDIWTTVLEPREVLTEIRIPYSEEHSTQSYQKFRQRASDWAIVAAAVDLRCRNDHIDDASVVLTNVASTPHRATALEEALRGQPVSQQTVTAASKKGADGINPSPELKASPDYKRHLAQVLCRRALQTALQLS